MRRLAPASSVRECSRRERESGSRARGTGRDRLARDPAAARPVAPPDQPRPDPRRRRPPRIVGCRARARDRLHQSSGARRAGAGRGARHRLDRRRPRRPVRVALRAAHRTRHVAPGRALRRRGFRGRRAGRMAAHPGRPLSLRRVDAAPAGPVDSRGGGRRLGAGGRDSGRPGGWGQEERDAGVFSGRGTRDCRRRARLSAAARAAPRSPARSPPRAGLGTIAQGGAAIAMGLNFFITYGGEATGPSGALLTTIVLGVAVAQLAAPPLMALALRTTVASPVAPAPLTPAAAPAELSANATADWPR